MNEWYARKGSKKAHRLKNWPILGWYRSACGALTLPVSDWEPARWQHWLCRRCERLTSGDDSARLPARGGMSNGRV